jgi:hypothetical protein
MMIRWIAEDELGCACGNTITGGGFYAANASGEEVEPITYSSDSEDVRHSWDGSTWLCGGCGAVEIVPDFTEKKEEVN